MGKADCVDTSEIQEVEAFLEVQDQLQNLKNTYPGVFDELKEIANKYNTLLENADKEVRTRVVTCGPFVISSMRTTYDAEKFYDAVGREEFLKMGGTIETSPSYSLDKSRFDALAVQNKIPSSVVETVRKVSPSYKKPEKMIIP